jgi:hypothetical protein
VVKGGKHQILVGVKVVETVKQNWAVKIRKNQPDWKLTKSIISSGRRKQRMNERDVWRCRSATSTSGLNVGTCPSPF